MYAYFRPIFLSLIITGLLTACATPTTEPSTPDEVVSSIKAKKQWYCGPGLMGIRAVARFGLRMLGVPVVDLCKAVDVIIEADT